MNVSREYETKKLKNKVLQINNNQNRRRFFTKMNPSSPFELKISTLELLL